MEWLKQISTKRLITLSTPIFLQEECREPILTAVTKT